MTASSTVGPDTAAPGATAGSATDPRRCHPIRPLRATDMDRVRRFYQGLSTDSLYRRFFTGGQPGDAELRRLFHADPSTRNALVALASDTSDDVIGLGEGIALHDRPGVVEIAVVVADTWQGRGIGWQLVCTVVRHAATRGALTIEAHTLAENWRMARLMRRLWPDARPHPDGTLHTWLVPIGPALRAPMKLPERPAGTDSPMLAPGV